MLGSTDVHDAVFSRGLPGGGLAPGRIGLGIPGAVGRLTAATLIGWLPLALLSVSRSLLSSTPDGLAFFSDFAVHARMLVAVPALILGDGDCLPRLDRIVRHFIVTGIVRGTGLSQFQDALSSTRRLLGFRGFQAVGVACVYGFIVWLLFLIPNRPVPEWLRGDDPALRHLTPAGWWHTLVSLPLLLMLFLRWAWRLALWARLLWLTARLDLHLIPGHPDRSGGLRFVSSCFRGFRLIGLALGAVLAGTVANSLVHQGASPIEYTNYAIALLALIVVVFAAPLIVFMEKLRETKRRGVFEYGALAGFLGREFDDKWLLPNAVSGAALTVTDFSATTDLYSVVRNAYEMQDLPFGIKDLMIPIEATALPFVPVAIIALPMQTIVREVVKLLL
jgi:hypothetical protein